MTTKAAWGPCLPPPSLAREGRFLIEALAILLILSGCVGLEPERLVAQQDHRGLTLYYTYEARELRQPAAEWERLAERYEQSRDRLTGADPGASAARCRAIAGLLHQAADEADRLAAAHRQAAATPSAAPTAPD